MSFRTVAYFILFLASAAGIYTFTVSSGPAKKKGLIAFYNVENLFDTLDDPHASDSDFLPSSSLHWNSERYAGKKNRLAEAIQALQAEHLVLMGLAEVENKEVIRELLNHPRLSGASFKYIHEDSKDPRGIDVALLYTPEFKPLFHKMLAPCSPKNECLKSRSILAVKGLLAGDTVWVYVNHWPSRREGVEASEAKRLLVSEVLKRSIDSVQKHSHNKVIVMGDFNDTPIDRSVRQLCAAEKLFNPFALLPEGEGSIKYKKDWLLYDQILLSVNWKNKEKKELRYVNESAAVFHPLFLHYKENLKNGPFRTYRGKQYYGGYSDHFPVYLQYQY